MRVQIFHQLIIYIAFLNNVSIPAMTMTFLAQSKRIMATQAASKPNVKSHSIIPKQIGTIKINPVAPRSKILKLPDIPSRISTREPESQDNPFHMPSDVQVFSMRENDRNAKRQVSF